MMKPTQYVFMAFFILIISGCQNSNELTKPVQKPVDIPVYNSSSEDVVDRNGDIKNIEGFEVFYQNVEQGQKDSIRVVRYTTEGDPMLHYLEYDGEIIKSVRDTRRDTYGEGKVSNANCKTIDVKETEESKDYVLEGCDRIEDNIILTVWD
ncbi:hypothetical protein OBCHQ24_01320 [Oceanobacillus iheyensis]|nr:hypothetical protein OBCHQ24_01320 [Oceanobacillus iheyensis]